MVYVEYDIHAYSRPYLINRLYFVSTKAHNFPFHLRVTRYGEDSNFSTESRQRKMHVNLAFID